MPKGFTPTMGTGQTTGLRAARRRAGRGATASAAYVGVTLDTLYGWERGERSIPMDKAVALLKLYRRTCPDLTLDDMAKVAGGVVADEARAL